jgi:hypothetical protein
LARFAMASPWASSSPPISFVRPPTLGRSRWSGGWSSGRT